MRGESAQVLQCLIIDLHAYFLKALLNSMSFNRFPIKKKRKMLKNKENCNLGFWRLTAKMDAIICL